MTIAKKMFLLKLTGVAILLHTFFLFPALEREQSQIADAINLMITLGLWIFGLALTWNLLPYLEEKDYLAGIYAWMDKRDWK